ncbi:recombinase family protein [Mobilitalea sibirica]|uniref:Recombinase family protein n=1 Tax=Mobilitalea sibirica TaxID=1462919 RepID=A0A8J7H180_9FIRM|nr:recombinase family protein [Mobilitalea sibirica]MBH1940094.1 recombinase family protein [Mobilitalea sibirica]
MKAVYYCRVSTEEESQINALDKQVQEAENCIKNNNWELIDTYIDEGKSGTSTYKRDEYIRLFEDISTDKFDIIVIKSQDRLMRNVKDWYLFIDKLVVNNKKLYFYLENRFYTPDDSLITGIKAILAEEYSRELSKKIKNAHKNRQTSKGKPVITSNTWGYDNINKEIHINEKEAEIVRLIYDLCIKGYGSRSISKELSNREVKSRTGNDFAEITVRRIIRNPLFKGTVVMNKRRIDFNTKKTVHVPEDEWIIHENAVPAIVSSDIWERANSMMDARSTEVNANEFKQQRNGKNIGKYNLSGKIFCGMCGEVFWRRYRRKKSNYEQIVEWSCCEYIRRGRKTKTDNRGKEKQKVSNEKSGCDNIHIKEEDLYNLLLEISKDIFGNKKEDIINKAITILRAIFSEDTIADERKSIDDEMKKILNQKDLLMDKLLEGVITNEDYKRKDADLEKRLTNIRNQELELIEKEKEANDIENRLLSIKKILENRGADLACVNQLVDHIEKIIVFNEHLEIYLDFYEPIQAKIYGQGKAKKYQYVDTSKHLTSIDNQIT